ncbi:MAG: GGDEF domain-containing protein [Myxococcales bacterium]|nr:GGDEF domain-containing protein [Myxococcales bacterium]
MSSAKEPPDAEAEPNWQARTQVTRLPELPRSGGSDCLVVIYTREGRGPIGKRVPLDGPIGELSLGRDVQNNLVLDYESVSRRHAKLVRRDAVWWVVDNNSTNGTYVNDQPTRESPLRNGDRIKIGDVILKYLSAGDLEAEFMSTISQMMVTDGLTQAANKRYLVEQINNELKRSMRHGRPLGLIMFDIDHFKHVNDTYGHVAGDFVLKEVAEIVRGRIRNNEVFGRYGGEEFALLLPETTLQGAYSLAQDLRELVQARPFVFDSYQIPVTVSLGVAEWAPNIKTSDEFIRVADDKLYQAKRGGRNRVVG